MWRRQSRAQTNIDFAIAGIGLAIFLSSTLLVPTSPLFASDIDNADRQIEAETELTRIEQEVLRNSNGTITSDAICNDFTASDIQTANDTKANVTFASVGLDSHAGIESENNCDTSYGPNVLRGVESTRNRTVMVDGELTQITINMWPDTSE